MAAAGVPVLPGYDGDDQADATLARRGPADRLPADAEALARGRRQGHAGGAGRVGVPRGARRVAPRGEGRLRGRRDGARALRRAPAARRGAGDGRRGRPHRCTSASASAPCSGATRRWSRRRRAPPSTAAQRRGPVRGRRRGGARGRLRQRGNGRVPALARRPLLLPRDEHAAAGRAPGDGGGHRPRPRAAAARGGGRAAAVRSPRRTWRRAATRSSAGSTPRTRSATTCPPRAASCTSRSPRGPASASTRGSTSGSEVTVHYDPLLSKVVTWGHDRGEAIERMRDALRRTVVLGVVTNLARLRAIVEHPAFAARRPAHRLHRGAPLRADPEPLPAARGDRRGRRGPGRSPAPGGRARAGPRRTRGRASGRGAWAEGR